MAVHNPSGTAGFYVDIFPVQLPLHFPFLLSMGGNIDLLLSPKPSQTLVFFNGYRYLVLDHWGYDWIGVWRSIDGRQWTEMDRGGHLDYSGSGKADHYGWHDETNDKMYVAYAYSDSEIRIKPFDLASNTWESEITGGPAAALASLKLGGGSYRDYFPIVRSDGSLVIIWREYNASSKMRIRMSIWTSGGGWAATVSIDPSAEAAVPDSNVAAVWLDSADRIHVLITDDYRLVYHVSIDADDTVNQWENLSWRVADTLDLVCSAGAGSTDLAAGMSHYNQRHIAISAGAPMLARALPENSPNWEARNLSWDHLCSNKTTASPGSIPIPTSKAAGGWWILVPDSADIAAVGLSHHYLLPISRAGMGTEQLAFTVYGPSAQGLGMRFTENGIEKMAFVIQCGSILDAMFYWEEVLSNFTDDSPGGFTRYAY